MTIFSLGVKGSVTPEHRVSMLLSALICAVAGVSYAVNPHLLPCDARTIRANARSDRAPQPHLQRLHQHRPVPLHGLDGDDAASADQEHHDAAGQALAVPRHPVLFADRRPAHGSHGLHRRTANRVRRDHPGGPALSLGRHLHALLSGHTFYPLPGLSAIRPSGGGRRTPRVPLGWRWQP